MTGPESLDAFRSSMHPACAFPDAADRELAWETLRTHPDEARSESALQALDRIFDRYDAAVQYTPTEKAPMRLDGDAEPPAGIPADGEEGAIRQQGTRREGHGSTEHDPSQSAVASMRDLMADQFPRVQRVAIVGANLAHHTRRMLFCLDRYWMAYEGGSPHGFDALWWNQYERSRAAVEAALRNRIDMQSIGGQS